MDVRSDGAPEGRWALFLDLKLLNGESEGGDIGEERSSEEARGGVAIGSGYNGATPGNSNSKVESLFSGGDGGESNGFEGPLNELLETGGTAEVSSSCRNLRRFGGILPSGLMLADP